ncbi:spermidine synthase, partial [Streptomyces sp. NPDC059802]
MPHIHHSDAPAPVTLDRREGPHGEVVLRERGDDFEIIANGCFLMDTSDGRSERLLIDAALAALPTGRPAPAGGQRGVGGGGEGEPGGAPPPGGGRER